MDNQHRKITGYRELSQPEIDKINKVKAAAKAISELVEELENDELTDKRWTAIGKTDLQTGFMALTRAITKPTHF